MAKIKKKSQRGLTTPEMEFRSIAGHLAEYYGAYQKQINTALTVLVVAFLGWLLYSFVSAGKEAKAGQMFEAAYAAYEPSGGSAPDYQRALMGFQEVVNQYGGTLNGAVAQYFAGNALMRLGRNDEAVKEYQAVAGRHRGRTFLMVQVYQHLGYAYLALGNREEAVSAFRKAEDLGGAGTATMELARIYERAGNSDEAQKKYKELSEKLPATTLALEAQSKLPPPDMKAPFSTGQTATGK